MKDARSPRYNPVDASPVKSFFVSMLTRDIKLEDAILDLLDNCVDGILRSGGGSIQKPFKGYKAEIEFNAESFSIWDNCGGIPWDLHEYAFRMGRSSVRPTDVPGAVGVYGIGMKRAIFKMGKHCLISTRHDEDQYEVEISPDWISDESNWEIPVRNASKALDSAGTEIVVGELYRGISKTFDEGFEAFQSELYRMVATHYAYIMEKGFEVKINGDKVKPRTTKLVYDDSEVKDAVAVQPFMFETTSDGVDVFLAVGFTRPIPLEDEIEEELEGPKYSSIDAGWTILCNDRAVLHSDRSELTGWGEAGVPRYHNQFIAISGIVDFRSEDPRKLPTTTTKRGIDATSPLYLQVKNKMREGMRIFTDYTNKWKGRPEESRIHIQEGRTLSLEELRLESEELIFRSTRTLPPGSQFKPRLPLPRRIEPTSRRISFVREIERIEAVAEYIGDPDMRPADVGEYCFDAVYEEVSR